MEYLDARRLPGPNVHWAKPGAVLDIACTAEEADALIPWCVAEITRMLSAVGWGDQDICHRRLAGGVSIAFSAPIDVLYAASALCEWAWSSCDARFNGADMPDFDEAADSLRVAIDEEANPALLDLEAAARARGVAFLWDDDEVSLGHGSHAETWPFRELPPPDSLDWSRYRSVPVGIVTGTNGKTTTVRIARHILQHAGRTVGMSCTDWVSVNDEIIDRDDWSGPGGARLVLRQPGVDAAILETARGGLLRRGLGIETANAALITNIAEDHLGDFGSQSLDELLDIKWVISHAAEQDGHLVLNADDALLVGKADTFCGRIAWFSLDGDNPVISAHRAGGGTAAVHDDGQLIIYDGESATVLCSSDDVPITLGGAATHNIANALGAALLTRYLGLSLEEIRVGLMSMSQDANPGRSNLFAVDGFQVLVDFAHNPQAMQALFAMARSVPARRRVLCFGQAGDRTDDQIRDLARSAWSIGLDQVMIAELAHYHRGREHGAVFDIIRDELLACGATDQQVRHFEEESESFDAAIDWARDGDLVVILDLGRDSNIQEKLRTLAEQ
jgi:UDP-N-acetylmuramyl tripeptide synthase